VVVVATMKIITATPILAISPCVCLRLQMLERGGSTPQRRCRVVGW
jgi:hypothetical protein